MTANQYLFFLIHQWANHFPILDWIGIFLADYVAYAIGLAAVIVLFYPRPKRDLHQQMIIVALVSGLFARYVVKTFIVLFYSLPRPFVVLPSIHPLISVPHIEYYQSFPSGHALFFFAFSMSIYFFNKKLGLWLLVISSIMGVARVFAGVHWPLDIIWGALIGMTVSLFFHYIYLGNKNQTSSLKIDPRK